MASLHRCSSSSLLALSAALLPALSSALAPQMSKVGLAPTEQRSIDQSFSGFIPKTAYPGDYWDYRNESCAVYSDKYRFIWVKLRRTGGTSTLKALKGSLCGVFIPDESNLPDSTVNHAFPCPDQFILDHNQGSTMDCNTVPPSREKWESYFVFTFTRDPWNRWDSLQRFCHLGEFCNACGTSAHGMCPPNHIMDQAGFVMSPDNASYVDFVGHTETLGRDLEIALSEVARRYQARTGHEVEWTNHSSMTDTWDNAAPGHANTYCDCPHCISAVSEAYRRDVDHLGYEAPSC